MKKTRLRQLIYYLLLPLLLILSLPNLMAQPQQIRPQLKIRTDAELKTFYQTRETKAPPVIQKRLGDIRTRINTRKLSFSVGYTGASDRPMTVLAGEKDNLTPAQINSIKTKMVNLRAHPQFKIIEDIRLAILPASYDSRTKGWVSPIRDQGTCGSCWAFGSVAMYESNFLKQNGSLIDASEQQALDCVAGNCGGGLAYDVFDWMVDGNKNLKTESAYAYVGSEKTCPTTATTTKFYATTWKILREDGDISKIADDNVIKRAIMNYGAVSASLVADDDWHDYTGGILDGMASNVNSPSSNHAILIIGWDDGKQAWLVKNSWGTDWGLDGFCWVKYGCYNIGRRAAVVVAKSTADCISMNPDKIQITADNKIVDGPSSLFAFPNRAEAQKAFDLIKKYRFNSLCFVGRPDPSMTYLLVNGNSPTGAATGEDCLKFDPAKLKIVQDGSSFYMTDGTSRMRTFPNKAEADEALAIIKKYGFTYTCYVGRPDPSFEYWRK